LIWQIINDARETGCQSMLLDTLPFLPVDFLYEVIPNVKKQFQTVSALLNREDVDTIYICTDSGREGEYIYRLVDEMAKVPAAKKRLRFDWLWIISLNTLICGKIFLKNSIVQVYI